MRVPLTSRSTRRPAVRAPWVTLAVVSCSALGLICPSLLELSREGIARGELWRLATGHLVHYSLYHFLVDAGTLLLIGGLYEARWGPGRWSFILLACALAISAGFLGLEERLLAYRGLSGIDCAAFAGAILIESRARPALGVGLAALFSAKLIYEQVSGGFLFPTFSLGEMGLPVLSAHTIGALGGFVGGLALWPWNPNLDSSPPPAASSISK